MKPRMEAAARRPLLALAAAEPSRPDDPELVRALRAGEAWAATAVWNAYASRVFRVAARASAAGIDPELELRSAARRYADLLRSWERSNPPMPA